MKSAYVKHTTLVTIVATWTYMTSLSLLPHFLSPAAVRLGIPAAFLLQIAVIVDKMDRIPTLRIQIPKEKVP